MDCDRLREVLIDHVDGLLGRDEAEAARLHLAACGECRRLQEEVRRNFAALDAWEDEELPAGRLDPAIHQLLVDVLGPYPLGTLLLLPGGELVVVVDGGARRQGRPVARRLLHADGGPDSRSTLLEVTAPGAARILEPSQVDLDWRRAVLL